MTACGSLSMDGSDAVCTKAEAERFVWKFVKEQNPSFTVNSILPATNYGLILSNKEFGSTAGLLRELYKSGTGGMTMLAPRKSSKHDTQH